MQGAVLKTTAFVENGKPCADFTREGSITSNPPVQSHIQTIKTANGQQAVILVDANTRQPLQLHQLTGRHTSTDSDSLPFTMKDVIGDFSTSHTDDGKVGVWKTYF